MIVSVIMPLFNAKKYLPEALGSVLRQTCGNFEIICINDDSANLLSESRLYDIYIRADIPENNGNNKG